VLAVFLTLAGTYLFKIVLSTFTLFMILVDSSRSGGEQRDGNDEERQALLSPDSVDAQRYQATPNGNGNRNADVHHRRPLQPLASSTGSAVGTVNATTGFQTSSISNDQNPTSATPDGQGDGQGFDSSGQSAASVTAQSTSGRALGRNVAAHMLKKDGEHKTLLTVVGTAVLALFIARVIATLFSAKVATDNAARWSSESGYCGVWRLNTTKSGKSKAVLNDIMYMREKEARAGEYARNCYGHATTLQSMHCDFFYRQKIKYDAAPVWDCSFAEEVCFPYQQSIVFDTGSVDINDIGVNSKHPYKFRRRTNCSALSVEDQYVHPETKNGATTYYYKYGTKGGDNYTYKTTGNPHDWHAPNYLVR
jgi:hypothetical protein